MKKKIISFILLVNFILLNNSITFWAWWSNQSNNGWPSINAVIDKYKYKNFFFQVELWNNIAKYCKNYTYSIDSVEKWLWVSSIYFVYRWDEANIAKHTFNFSCPIQVKWNLYYNLYANNNTKIVIDDCNSKYNELKKVKLWKDLFWKWQNICLFIPLNMIVNNLNVIQEKEETIKKVLPNKLGFNSIFKPITLSLVLFFVVLSVFVWKKSF